MQTSMSIARKAKARLAGCTKQKKECGGKRDKFIFRFGRSSKRVDLVDVVLQIMEEDGPKTWPKKKQRNGADMFYDEHQAEYEARGKQASDPARQVDQHNSGYPKLRDELAKRRSLTKVTAPLNENIPTRDVSVTKRRRNRTKKTYTRSRNNKNFKRKVKSRVTKVKSGLKKRTTSRTKYRKMKINKSCQYLRSIDFKTCGTSDDLDLLQVLIKEPSKHKQIPILAPITLNPTDKSDKDSKCSHLTKKNSELSKDSTKPLYYSKSKVSLKEKFSKSETSGKTSVTSYNSYLSIDHEPMD